MITRDDPLDAIAVIFARGGSKGLPKKNIRNFFGKPLIAWSIEHAMAVPRIRRIIVSTDSNEIASVARAFGAEVPFIRPKSLASDTSSEWLAWQHALKFIESEEGRLPDALVTVPTTAPLRKPSDLNDCLDLYSQGDVDAVLTVTESRRNPCFNMVRVNDNQILTLFSPVEKHITRRQDAPKAYDVTTVAYVASPHFVLNHKSIFDGRVKAILIPGERSIDIDTKLDFDMAEFLYMRLHNRRADADE